MILLDTNLLTRMTRSRILAYAQEIGWTYVPRDEAEQRRDSGCLKRGSPEQ